MSTNDVYGFGEPTDSGLQLTYGLPVNEASVRAILVGGGAVTLELDSKPATIPLSTYAVAGDWLRLVFKDNNDTYEYETAKQWSKESAESDTPSPLPPVEGNDGQLLMSQNGQWAPVDAEGGFGYIDEPTPLFVGTISNFVDNDGDYSATIELSDVPEDLFTRETVVVIVTDPNVTNETIVCDNGKKDTIVWDTARSISYRLSRDESCLLTVTKETSDPIEVSIDVFGTVHTIDPNYIVVPSPVFTVNLGNSSADKTYEEIRTADDNGYLIRGVLTSKDRKWTTTRVYYNYNDRMGEGSYRFDFSYFSYNASSNLLSLMVRTWTITEGSSSVNVVSVDRVIQ